MSTDDSKTLGTALGASAFHVALALAVNVVVFYLYDLRAFELGHEGLDGRRAATEFFLAWLLNRALALSGMFVVALCFAHFGLDAVARRRVLAWSIGTTLALRAPVLVGGLAATRHGWTVYVFGGLLILSAVRLLATRPGHLEPDHNLLVRLARRSRPPTDAGEGARFVVERDGRRHTTPALACLLVVLTSDLFFTLDAVPATFVATRDPVLAGLANLLALSGLRSMYLVVAAFLPRLRYLRIALAAVLGFLAAKVLVGDVEALPHQVSPAVVLAILAAGTLASVFAGERTTGRLLSPLADEMERVGTITLRQARRFVILIVGATLLLLGLLMLVTPGPGLVVFVLGLAVLAIEFAWARRWLAKTRSGARSFGDEVRRRLGFPRRDPKELGGSGPALRDEERAGPPPAGRRPGRRRRS